MDYVELNRCFVDVVEDQLGFDARSRAAWDEELERRTGWPELLQSARHVVILGEARAGKTTELREQARKVTGFFVRIEELAERGLAQALEVGAQYLDEWRRSASDGWFFLDSVDEAHLHGRRFEGAIRRLATELGPDAARVRVVASCRASDWRVHADTQPLEELTRHYRAPLHRDQAAPDAEDGRIRVVELAPLTRLQAFSFLTQQKKKVTERDANAFLDATDAAGAEEFMDRPGDVTWMFAYWKKHGRIGSISQLIEENVTQRLLEGNPTRRSSLSRERLRRGAEALAAACVLCQKAAIRVPDEEPLPLDAIAPEAVLDWPRDEIRELLALPLFDEGTYGRVRYHHRSVCEYLAACWVDRLLTLGCPQRKIEKFMFPSTYAKTQIVPAALTQVVGWLAKDHPWIRELTTKLAPGTLMGGGDPDALPTAVRARILEAVAASDHREPERPLTPSDALARFADPGLADTVLKLCENRDTSWRLRCELVLMIRWGRLETCIDLAFRLALDETEDEYVRMVAIDAVYDLGSVEQSREPTWRNASDLRLAHNCRTASLAGSWFIVFRNKAMLMHSWSFSRKWGNESIGQTHSMP